MHALVLLVFCFFQKK